MAFGIQHGRARQQGPRQRRLVTQGQSVRAAHGAQVAEELEQMGVAHREWLDVGHGKREAGALQQTAERAQVRERSDARTGAALDLDLGRRETVPHLRQRRAAEQTAEEQAIGFQGTPHLDERSRQVVDGMQCLDRDDEVEALRREGLLFLVGHEAPPATGSQGPRARRGPRDFGIRQSIGQGRSDARARRPEIQHVTEGSLDRGKPLDEGLPSRAPEENRHHRPPSPDRGDGAAGNDRRSGELVGMLAGSPHSYGARSRGRQRAAALRCA